MRSEELVANVFESDDDDDISYQKGPEIVIPKGSDE